MQLLLSSWKSFYHVFSLDRNWEENHYKLFAYFCPCGEVVLELSMWAALLESNAKPGNVDGINKSTKNLPVLG